MVRALEDERKVLNRRFSNLNFSWLVGSHTVFFGVLGLEMF